MQSMVVYSSQSGNTGMLAESPQAAGHPDQDDVDRLQTLLRECLDKV